MCLPGVACDSGQINAQTRCGSSIGRGILALTAVERIGTGTADQGVVALLPGKHIRACAAHQRVVALMAAQRIVAGATVKEVVAFISPQRVGSGIAEEGHVANEMQTQLLRPHQG